MIFEFKVKMWQLWKKYILNLFKSEREAYHIGYLKLDSYETNLAWFPSEENIEAVESALLDLGYQPNYFSFADEGQVTSMRKMYRDEKGYWRQTHIRVHEDGEIRGHDELSYEESAIAHVKGEGAKEIMDIEISNILNMSIKVG
jgi:hypothetical protein